MVDAFFLETPKAYRKNALAVDPAKGKTGKKLYFSPLCEEETATYDNRANEKRQEPNPAFQLFRSVGTPCIRR